MYPTLQYAIPAIELLQAEWEEIQDEFKDIDEDDPVIAVLQSGLDKLSAYYKKMEGTEAYGNALSMLHFFQLHLADHNSFSSHSVHQNAVSRHVVGRSSA